MKFDEALGGAFADERENTVRTLDGEPDTADTLLATAGEEQAMAVYRIEHDLAGVTTDDEPYAVCEVGTMGETDDDGEMVDTLKSLSTHPTEEEAQAEVDRLIEENGGVQETAVSDAETLGGKPNPGTKKDKRLHENDPKKKGKKSALEQAMEFAAKQGGAVSEQDLAQLKLAQDISAASNPDGSLKPGEGRQVTAAAKVKDQTQTMAGWDGTLCVEGVTTGDQREFAKGALTWADPPIPLRWKKEDAHGGQNDVTVAVGSITALRRVGNRIEGEGVFDLGSEDGREAHRRMKEVASFGGISIDADDITDADIEFIWPEQEETGDEDDILMMLFASPDKILFHAGRIRAATLVDIPAFVEAKIALTASGALPDGAEALTLTAAALDEQVRRETEYTTVTAAGVTPIIDRDAPPAEWFENPKLSVPMNVIVTDEGRVYGHAAHWDECHIGHPEMCITAPYEDRHDLFMCGELVCSDGSRVKVGQITVGTGHAPLPYGAQRAAEHYDNTGAAVVDVALGNDEHGIWLAGAVRSWADPAKVKELRAAGKVSGDWRRFGGQLRLVGLLAVNVGGFGYKTRSRVASGQQMALVSAGMPRVGSGTVDVEKAAMRFLMDQMSRQVHDAEET